MVFLPADMPPPPPAGTGWWLAADGRWYPPRTRPTQPPADARRRLRRRFTVIVAACVVAVGAVVAVALTSGGPRADSVLVRQGPCNDAVGAGVEFTSGLISALNADTVLLTAAYDEERLTSPGVQGPAVLRSISLLEADVFQTGPETGIMAHLNALIRECKAIEAG